MAKAFSKSLGHSKKGLPKSLERVTVDGKRVWRCAGVIYLSLADVRKDYPYAPKVGLGIV